MCNINEVEKLNKAKLAIIIIFFINGALIGSWATCAPFIKDQIGTTMGPFGLALLALPIVALITKQIGGKLVAYFGSAPITRIGIVISCLAVALPGLSESVFALAVALGVFGGSMGILDVSMNAHAIMIQSKLKRSIMSFFHGMYSVGALVGAFISVVLIGNEIIIPKYYLITIALFLAIVGFVFTFYLMPAKSDYRQMGDKENGQNSLKPTNRGLIILLGFAGLIGMAGEGATTNWSAIYLRDSLLIDPTFISAGYIAFSISISIGRLLSDKLIRRFGDLNVAIFSLIFGGCGFILSLLFSVPIVAISGFAILGLGISSLMPVVFSAAGRIGGNSTGSSITIVSSIAGSSFVISPFLGYLADEIGLNLSLGFISIMIFCSAIILHIVNKKINLINKNGNKELNL